MSIVITKIEPQKRNKGRVNLYDADGFFVSLSLDTLLKYRISEGAAISEAQLQLMKGEDTVKYAKEISVAYIAYAPRTERQVREHLKKKDIDAASIEEAVASLYKYGFLDDAAYVHAYVRAYSKKLGIHAMRMKLKERGIENSIIEANLQVEADAQWYAAKTMAEKLEARYKEQEPYKAKQKMYAALARKGFDYDVIKKVLNVDEGEE